MRMDEYDPMNDRRKGYDPIAAAVRADPSPAFSHARARAFIRLALASVHEGRWVDEYSYSLANAIEYEVRRNSHRARSDTNDVLNWVDTVAVLAGNVGLDTAIEHWRLFLVRQFPTDDLAAAAIQLDVMNELALRRKEQTPWQTKPAFHGPTTRPISGKDV